MGWVVNATPRPLTPGKETRYPLYRRLGGPQGRSEWCGKSRPPPGFGPLTVQLVASRYTDSANPAHNLLVLLSCDFNNFITLAKAQVLRLPEDNADASKHVTVLTILTVRTGLSLFWRNENT